MDASELAKQVAHTPAGGDVRIGAGEFEGPWTLDRPVRLIGVGPATVLWSHRGPALTVRAPGIHLEALAVEVLDSADDVALLVTDDARVRPPTLAGVRLVGRVEGLGLGGAWRFPPAIDLGEVSPSLPVQRTLGLDLPGPVVARTDMTGLRVDSRQVASGRWALHLTFSEPSLLVGSLLEGRIELEASGLQSVTRVTGKVVAGGKQPPPPSSDQESVLGLDIFGILPRQPEQPSRPEVPLPESPLTPMAESGSTEVSWVSVLQSEARKAMEAGDIGRAIELLGQALKLQPDGVQLHADMAGLYSRKGYFDGALDEWKEVSVRDPGFPELPIHLGRCYNQLGRYEDAVPVLERALRYPSGSKPLDIYQALAMAYYHSGRLAEALWALAQACRLDSNNQKLAALLVAWQRQSSLEH